MQLINDHCNTIWGKINLGEKKAQVYWIWCNWHLIDVIQPRWGWWESTTCHPNQTTNVNKHITILHLALNMAPKFSTTCISDFRVEWPTKSQKEKETSRHLLEVTGRNDGNKLWTKKTDKQKWKLAVTVNNLNKSQCHEEKAFRKAQTVKCLIWHTFA